MDKLAAILQTRIFNHRDGLRADWSRIFAVAARLDKAVDTNGEEKQLEKNDSALRRRPEAAPHYVVR
jgi:hypothetical protein